MEYYLIVSAIMFFAGIYGFFTRRNTCSTAFFFRGALKVISSPCSPSPSRLRKQLLPSPS